MEIILLEPKKQENLGAIARVMANFDFNNLVLINPKCKIGIKAKKVAKHAQDILKKAKIKDFSYLKKLDYLIGTTAILGTDYNIPRNAISIEQLSNKIMEITDFQDTENFQFSRVSTIKNKNTINKKINNKKNIKKISNRNNNYKKNMVSSDLNIGLLIGRESSGLNNEEINLCDILITIPASKKYPTLNVSHALSIILYELSKKNNDKSNSHINFATKKDKDIILKYLNKILNKLNFTTKEKKETQKIVWKRIIGKALLTKREAFAVMGFLRKLK